MRNWNIFGIICCKGDRSKSKVRDTFEVHKNEEFIKKRSDKRRRFLNNQKKKKIEWKKLITRTRIYSSQHNYHSLD